MTDCNFSISPSQHRLSSLILNRDMGRVWEVSDLSPLRVMGDNKKNGEN